MVDYSTLKSWNNFNDITTYINNLSTIIIDRLSYFIGQSVDKLSYFIGQSVDKLSYFIGQSVDRLSYFIGQSVDRLSYFIGQSVDRFLFHRKKYRLINLISSDLIRYLSFSSAC